MSVDKGTPPPGAMASNLALDRFMHGEDDAEIQRESFDIVSGRPNPTPSGEAQPFAKLVDVKITSVCFQIWVKVSQVCIVEHQLGLHVPFTDLFKFQPMVNTRYVVEHGGTEYPCVYMGGSFPLDGHQMITFFLEKPDDEDGTN
jgi:hypothetical protein